MAEKKEIPSGVLFECMSCGAKITSEQLIIAPETKCPSCGYRVLKKIRPPVVKTVKSQ